MAYNVATTICPLHASGDLNNKPDPDRSAWRSSPVLPVTSSLYQVQKSIGFSVLKIWQFLVMTLNGLVILTFGIAAQVDADHHDPSDYQVSGDMDYSPSKY